MTQNKIAPSQDGENQSQEPTKEKEAPTTPTKEYGGPKGKEPTRYGDWEKNGRCIDF